MVLSAIPGRSLLFCQSRKCLLALPFLPCLHAGLLLRPPSNPSSPFRCVGCLIETHPGFCSLRLPAADMGNPIGPIGTKEGCIGGGEWV